VLRVALWVLGEYAISQDEVSKAFAAIKRNVGSLPIYPEPSNEFEEPTGDKTESEESKEKAPKVITKTVVLADGSYGTQTIVVNDENKIGADSKDESNYLPLRRALITTEDDYLASCLAITMTKLVIKSKRNLSKTYT
jgi:coatomer subunit beta